MTASAGCGLVVPSEFETRVYKKWSGGVRRATTFCRMSAGVAAWAAVAVKRDDKIGQTGCDKQARRVCRGRQVKCAAGGGGGGDRIGGGGLVLLSETWAKPRGWNFSLFVYANCGG